MNAAIKIVNVTKKIGKRTIIDNFSVDINKGEIFGLLGPNGAGKTTLIRMIVGLISITSGDILINNKSIKSDFKSAINDIGALVESPAIYQNLSGYDNLKIFSRMYDNITTDDIKSVVKVVNLQDSISIKTEKYSLGMKQRLGIAIALLHNPSILILDEPTNGLDPQGILDLRTYLKLLVKERNFLVVVSSHMLSEMESLCDRFAIINKGKLVNVTPKIDPLDINGELTYSLELVDNKLKAFDLLKDKYKVNLENNILYVISSKSNIPKIIEILVVNNIKIYSVTPSHSSLEKYYFDAINGSESAV